MSEPKADGGAAVPCISLLATIRKNVAYKDKVLSDAQQCEHHPLRWYMSQDAAKHAGIHVGGILKDIDEMMDNTQADGRS